MAATKSFVSQVALLHLLACTEVMEPAQARDVQITTTQIHTHQIRGADVILIAREDPQLRRAVEGQPAALEHYYARYIRVPDLFGPDLFVYQAALTLQRLAFKMSVAKMKYLNKIQVENHGPSAAPERTFD